MPPLPAVPNCAQLRVIMRQSGAHDSENVFHFQWSGGVAATADMQAMTNNAIAAYQGLYTGALTGGNHYISADTTLMSARAQDLSSASGAFAETTDGATHGAASQQGIDSAALLISNKVHMRFRGGHGRTYIAGVSADNTTQGRLWDVGTINADMQTWFQDFIGDIQSGSPSAYPNITGVRFVIVSYVNKTVNPVPPYRRPVPLVMLVTNSTVDSVIRSQRRRVRVTPTPS